jgi:hypothetical protein
MALTFSPPNYKHQEFTVLLKRSIFISINLLKRSIFVAHGIGVSITVININDGLI